MKATPKQVSYLINLLAQAGYSTRYMDSRFKRLGATMNERSGSVSDWLASRTITQASTLIETLKTK
jgi:predicted Zn-dependent protease